MQQAVLQSCYGTEISNPANWLGMDDENISGQEADRRLIRDLAKWANKSPSDVAKSAGLTPSTLTRVLKDDVKHRLSTPTLIKLRTRFSAFPGFSGEAADHPDTIPDIAYEPIDVLPTYAGAGGGGTGEGDIERALIPSYLIRNVLRGVPSDFVLIRVRGDSMEPVFRHEDELLVDKRDRSPTQPGPFALWDADWAEYLVKNVERLPGGRVRIFSSNEKYTPVEVTNEETNILGRPVWFGRRL